MGRTGAAVAERAAAAVAAAERAVVAVAGESVGFAERTVAVVHVAADVAADAGGVA